VNRFVTVDPSTLYVTHIFEGEQVVRGGEDGQVWVATFASRLQADLFVSMAKIGPHIVSGLIRADRPAVETSPALGFGIPFLLGLVKERMDAGESQEEAVTKVAEHNELRSEAIAALRSALNR
jgi:hypothetical protein